MWAFGTSRHGLGLSELQFWLLTVPEFRALKAVYNQAHGVPAPLSRKDQEQLAKNQRYILEQQMRAHNRMIERRNQPNRRRCVASAEINAEALRQRRAAGIKDHD